ncbi:hypothetical protein GCM10022288_21930 [Gryllotalpicola kribbensis]|jgi:hypothetical protein|uniref:Uncharacterized protein n=1 Tax=Gryllotalpicola kribbensis TaxID=993084 RepID=A0ABP8AVV1_9MICO
MNDEPGSEGSAPDPDEARLKRALRDVDLHPQRMLHPAGIRDEALGEALDTLQELAHSDDPLSRTNARDSIHDRGLDLLLIDEGTL